MAMEPRDVAAGARGFLAERLAEYEKPEMDPKLEQKLKKFVEDRKHSR
jgi:trimethylamine:corrinoid methyltransferase-like protein